MRDSVVIVSYQPCPRCSDGSCRKCGPASGEHAAPGVCLVTRRIRFVRCGCEGGCASCGASTHPLAGAGVRIETVDERVSERWLPAVHLLVRDGNAVHVRCGAYEVESSSTELGDVTCGRCLKYATTKERNPWPKQSTAR